ADDETLNSIFRCAHSVKGGAATFGFNDVAELTHQMESLLDKLRRHELEPTGAMVDVLLQSGDALKAQLARHQSGGHGDIFDTAELLAGLRALLAGQTPRRVPAPAAAWTPEPEPEPEPAPPGGRRELELLVGPLETADAADNLIELFSEIVDLGSIEPLDGGQAADGMRRFKIVTTSSDTDLLDLFTFHIAREHVKLLPLGPGYGFHAGAPGAPVETASDAGFGFFDNAPGAPAPAGQAAAPAGGPVVKARAKATAAPAAAETSTLRVSVEKVDQLINLVGELVITQAMLAQTSAKVDTALYQQMAAGLADLERNTRDLQESVMSIRMIPMSAVFNRFPRMLRELAGKLGKKVDFVTQGEATELDKGMVEKITDPLTHLVRNSCDHGIEMPAERRALGKPETGTITLAASHQGGSIVIEVRDDGKGLNRDRLIAKAREKGLEAPDSMTDAEVWALVFAPGFSTAEVVTDVSGRGVGMDVVKKNITALGGTVEIESAEGFGMSVKVRLPLTLAIMDGMSVGVGDECYILPLASVIESFQVKPDTIRTIGGSGRVVQVRDEYMPVVDLEQLFNVPRFDLGQSNAIMVVVEAEGQRAALLVDALLGQQQVVVKNLESNYRRVDDVSGATIMGDGRVALILDVGALVR
ncbi:MAG: chemotaxis protein CheA, partial [Rubrivivax sp.]|nr:chemotaxis protein CheA [Rubrivivax sp.]